MKPKTAAPANEDDAPPQLTSSTMTTTKTVPNQQKKRKLVGYSNFKRANPHSDLFPVTRFHSIEFFCQDAKTTANRFAIALGMNVIGLSDQTTTGNVIYNSYAMKSNELVFVFTAPVMTEEKGYGRDLEGEREEKNVSDDETTKAIEEEKALAKQFVEKHGLAVKRVCVRVNDCKEAYAVSTKNGGVSVRAPRTLRNRKDGREATVAEVALYGDVELRFVEDATTHLDDDETYRYLDYDAVEQEQEEQSCKSEKRNYGLKRLDHCVGNVSDLIETVEYIEKMLGFHEFAEFVAADVGTVDSGLNSMVLANNDEFVLLPVNEPTFGTRRKSQIQTYLEANNGAGVQHLALKTDDIIHTVTEMKKYSGMFGGFDFQPPASEKYYQNLKAKVGDALSDETLKECERLGLLVDKDDQGVLIQIFTKPLTDRPTIFIEIIQRIGCEYPKEEKKEQAAGCGGFGKGNFAELFKSIENYEKSLEEAKNQAPTAAGK